MSSDFSTLRLAGNGGDDPAAALVLLDRLSDAFRDLQTQSHNLRCELADLLDNEISSTPYTHEVRVRLLERLECRASTLNRSVIGYGQSIPEDQPCPEVFDLLAANGWKEQDPCKTDGHVYTPPNGRLTDRTRGHRRVFARGHQQLMVWFTAPHVVAYAWLGTRWLTDVAELVREITTEPVNLGRLIAKAEAARRAELKKPFGLTVAEIVERAQACRWELVRDDPCTVRGIVGMPFIGMVPKDERPGRSVTLRAPDRDIEVTAWGLPGQPAGGVRYWLGPVRGVEELNRILGYSEV